MKSIIIMSIIPILTTYNKKQRNNPIEKKKSSRDKNSSVTKNATQKTSYV